MYYRKLQSLGNIVLQIAESNFNHCDAIVHKVTEFREITLITTITPFKVIQGHQCRYQWKSVASLGGGGRTAPGDTLQGGDTRRKKIFVGKFTKNSGDTRSDR